MGTGTGAGTGTKAVAERNGDENGNGDGNKDGTGGGGGEAKKRKRPHESCCKRDVENGGELEGKRKIRRQERVGSVAADPDGLESSEKAARESQDTQGLSKNCMISKESVSLLSCLIRGFCNKYH